MLDMSRRASSALPRPRWCWVTSGHTSGCATSHQRTAQSCRCRRCTRFATSVTSRACISRFTRSSPPIEVFLIADRVLPEDDSVRSATLFMTAHEQVKALDEAGDWNMRVVMSGDALVYVNAGSPAQRRLLQPLLARELGGGECRPRARQPRLFEHYVGLGRLGAARFSAWSCFGPADHLG